MRGIRRPAIAAYIAITSRFLGAPMNVAFVAPSGAGKNRAVDEACALFPEEAVYIIKAASERALIYNQEQFQHRTVIFAEADSIPEDGPAASAVRNLATDNVMEYEVTIPDEQTGGYTTQRIRKPGPTGLITTSIKSPGEQLGTRLLEIAIPDDEAQTRAVMQAQARRAMAPMGATPDLEPFLALQRYLALRGIREVAVPYAAVLADLVPASAVRTRRDFPQLLTAIQAIAFLYQAQRERTPDGWVVATIDGLCPGARDLCRLLRCARGRWGHPADSGPGRGCTGGRRGDAARTGDEDRPRRKHGLLPRRAGAQARVADQ